MSKWLLGLTVAGMIMAGCSSGSSGGTTPSAGVNAQASSLTDIAKGADSKITEARRVAVKDQAAWDALWREHHGGDDGRPAVDFDKEMVLAVFAGERLTAGYVITIQDIQQRGSQWLVNVREASPGSGDVAAQVLTTPFHLVRTPRRDGEIVFIEAPGVPSTP